jgi:tetratricopeptide (TPR) repeat protein
MTFPRVGVALALVALATACSPGVDPAAVQRQKGDELMAKSDFAGAAAEYARSLEANPKQEKTWEKLAMCRLRLDDRDGAAAALLKTLDFKADVAQKAEVYRNAAGIYLQAQDGEKAEKYLQEVLRLLPDDENSLTWLGELASQRGGARSNDGEAVPEQLDAALRYYDRLIILKPDSPVPYIHKRIVLTKYVLHYTARKKAAEQALKHKKKAEQAEALERMAGLQTRIDELRRTLDEVTKKLTELRKPKPAGGAAP